MSRQGRRESEGRVQSGPEGVRGSSQGLRGFRGSSQVRRESEGPVRV